MECLWLLSRCAVILCMGGEQPCFMLRLLCPGENDGRLPGVPAERRGRRRSSRGEPSRYDIVLLFHLQETSSLVICAVVSLVGRFVVFVRIPYCISTPIPRHCQAPEERQRTQRASLGWDPYYARSRWWASATRWPIRSALRNTPSCGVMFSPLITLYLLLCFCCSILPLASLFACWSLVYAPGVMPKQVIIIPAALVSPFAYSILARSLAQRGYPSFVVRLPFNLGIRDVFVLGLNVEVQGA